MPGKLPTTSASWTSSRDLPGLYWVEDSTQCRVFWNDQWSACQQGEWCQGPHLSRRVPWLTRLTLSFPGNIKDS